MKRELGYGVEELTETRPWERFELVGPEEERRTWEVAPLALCAISVGLCLLLGGCKGGDGGPAIPEIAGPCPQGPVLVVDDWGTVGDKHLVLVRRVR